MGEKMHTEETEALNARDGAKGSSGSETGLRARITWELSRVLLFGSCPQDAGLAGLGGACTVGASKAPQSWIPRDSSSRSTAASVLLQEASGVTMGFYSIGEARSKCQASRS